MKFWRYTHYDVDTGVYALGFPIKDPEIISETSPGADYVEVPEALTLVGVQAKGYEFYRNEGQKYFNWFRSLYLVNVSSGLITMTDANHIYGLTDTAMQEVDTGSWHSCYNFIQGVPVDAIFTQERKDELLNKARDFINANYPPAFHVI